MANKTEIRQLEIFVAIYTSGNFTKASEALAISQPAISAQIKNLERNLDAKLFDRLGRFIRPTEMAELLFPKALEIIKDVDGLGKLLNTESQQIAGKLIIGASSIPGAYTLPPIAAVFKEKYPDISFEIKIADSEDIINSVLSHDLLIGIVGTKTQAKNLQFLPFTEDELVLAAGAERGIGNNIDLQQLLKLPFLLRENGSGTRKSLLEVGVKSGFEIDQFNTVATLGSNAAIKEAIKANLGVSILSRISILDEIESGKIKEINVTGLTMQRIFYIVTQQQRTLPNNYSAFLKRLRET